jgi:hypothetical protein
MGKLRSRRNSSYKWRGRQFCVSETIIPAAIKNFYNVFEVEIWKLNKSR